MKRTTSYHLVGKLVGVDAVVAGPTATVRVQLILDTGATMTTIVPRVAAMIGYSADMRLHWVSMRTAAAVERGYAVYSTVAALGFRARRLKIAVAGVADKDNEAVDGLLGFDFLRHFNVEIRPREQRLILEIAA